MKIQHFSIFIFLLFTLSNYSQNRVNDCTGAIQICGDGAINSSAEGIGTQEISGLNSCSSMEHNSLWVYIEITREGTLGFELKPTSSNLAVDYDFFIFGPNVSCGNLGQAIRCSTTNPIGSGASSNHTGMRDDETDTAEGPGADGNNFIKSLDVMPGETYYIVIDRPIGNSPFDLEWTGTATIGGSPFPEGPEISKPGNLSTCNATGSATFDFQGMEDEITTQANTTLSYHENLAEATENIKPIVNSYTSSQPRKTIYARVENDITGCAKITEFDLIINPGPEINLNTQMETCDIDYSGSEVFYLDETIPSLMNGLNPENFIIQFFQSGEDASSNSNPLPQAYNSAGETIYARVHEKSNTNCFNISELDLTLNLPPQLEDYELIQPSVNSNSNTIELQFSESSDYEYSIGSSDGPYQEETTFSNVSSGIQELYIRDKKGCAVIKTQIAILGYDNFFTPNGDGINDFWQIRGVNNDQGNQGEVHIFDRYGKLIKLLRTDEKGWDGNFNGNEMPSADYWFQVRLENNQEFNGHFSLVR